MSDADRSTSDTRIELFLRPDYPMKSGGDLVLARQFETALREAGADVALEPIGAAALDRGAGPAQIFNVDRYFEFAASAHRLQQAGRPYVVSPVHHPTAFVDRFERERRRSALKAIAAVGRTAYGRERIKHALRGRSTTSVREALVGDARAAVRTALHEAALVVLQAPTEAEQLERTFGAELRSKSVWVPNGVTVDETVDVRGERDIDLLVAGRIEERKNQLAVAQAFAGSDLQVTIVGGDNPRSAAYSAEVHALIERSANLRHIPHVSLEELRGLYARSKVLFSASRFEVVSLAELEAVAYGCGLVSTTGGYMSDYLGQHAAYVDPAADPQVLREAADSAVVRGVNEEGMALVRREYTWGRTHAALVGAYRDAGLLPD